jgi:hypothetical protein
MDNPNVPYIVHEVALARAERNTKRFFIALEVCIILLFGSNAIWLYCWTSYDYLGSETQTVTVDGKEGTANFIGNDGVIYGQDKGQDQTGQIP